MLKTLVLGSLALLAPFWRTDQTVPPTGPHATAPQLADAQEADGIEVVVGPTGVSVFAIAADAHALLVRIAQATGLKVVIDDTVNRTITVNLVNLKVTEILDHIVSAFGLSCKEVNGIYMVSEGIPKTPSSYLLSDIEAIGTQYVLAEKAKQLLPTFLQDHVKTNREQNSVILSAPPEVLKKFRQDIGQFDIPSSQILIELLMVEFTDASSDEFSLKWGGSRWGSQSTVDTPFGDLVFRTLSGLPSSFSADLRALVTKGQARVRANPRIATVSGQNASIFIGKQRYLSTPVVVSSSDYSESTKNSIDAGVRLAMTPWTGGSGEIIVSINPEISVLSAPDVKTGLPDKSTRRATTTVHVRDGETIIIGGLVQRESIKTRTKVPILGDIPILGQLFRSHDLRESTTEMVIFITPHILTQTGHLPPDQEQRMKEQFLSDEPNPQPKR